MKRNVVDIVRTVDEMIDRFNKQNEEGNTGKVYEVVIKTKRQSSEDNKKREVKKVKVIHLYLHDLDTKERLSLFDSTFIPKTFADSINANYRVILYRELLYFCLSFSAINLESHVKEQRAKKAIETASKLNT